MLKLGDDLKGTLSALAHQDAGEFLSMNDKMKELGFGPGTRAIPASRPRVVERKPATHRIALISDGRGFGAPLDYAIDACVRQGAKIDLLTHSEADTTGIATLESHIQAAGLDSHNIQLGINPADDIADYISNQPSLIFLIAMPDDNAAKELIEEMIPKRRGRISVPLVLIEDRPSATPAKLSAA